MVGPDRSPVRDPENRSGAINVAAQVKAILVEVRERRKLRLEGRRTLNLNGKWGPRSKRLSVQDVPVEKIAVSTAELSKFQKSLNIDEQKSGKVLEEPQEWSTIT